MLGIGDPTSTTDQTPLEMVRNLRSRFPNPTNAQAAAALDSFSQYTAAQLIGQGVRSDVAESFAPPDGVLPRMRLLAWGWQKPGDKFKSPQDGSWWAKRYQFPLWAPLETYMDMLQRAGTSPPAFLWNDDMARGDPAELSMMMPSLVQDDLPPVNEAPCPKWLIPPTRGMLPIPNPACLKKPIKDVVERLRPKESTNLWPWLLLLGLIVLARKDRQ